MDAATGSTNLDVLLHDVNKKSQGSRLKVDVSIEGEQEGVVSPQLFATGGQVLGEELEAQEVVHVHHLKVRTIHVMGV